MGRVADGVLFAEVAGNRRHFELRMNILGGAVVQAIALTKNAGRQILERNSFRTAKFSAEFACWNENSRSRRD